MVSYAKISAARPELTRYIATSHRARERGMSMLKNFAAAKSATNHDLIVIYAADAKRSIACVVTLDTLADLFGKRTISQGDAERVVRAEIEKFEKVILAKFELDPFAFTQNPDAPNVFRYDLTLQDLQVGGQTYSASVLDAPPTSWGKEGKF
jgi:hypothetical protein